MMLPFPRVEEEGKEYLHRQEGAQIVEFHDFTDGSCISVKQSFIRGDDRSFHISPCRIDQHIDFPEFFLQEITAFQQGVLVGNIRYQGQGFPVLLPDAFYEGLDLFRSAPKDYYESTFRGQVPCQGGTEDPGGATHDNDFIFNREELIHEGVNFLKVNIPV